MTPPMDISPGGLLFIAGWEKYMSVPYKDEGGRTTWGYGHLQKPGEIPPKFISQQDALALLKSDAAVFVGLSNKAVRVSLNQNQFDAFVSILFNVGPGVPKVKDGIIMLKSGKPSTLLANINARAFGAAANQFLAWDKVDGNVSLGLQRRRTAERQLFLKQVPPALTHSGATP